MEKPHRFLMDKVASYAEEASAYARRRRLRARRFARVGLVGGAIEAHEPGSETGAALIAVADRLLGAEPADG
jgi:hypothetical protein